MLTKTLLLIVLANTACTNQSLNTAPPAVSNQSADTSNQSTPAITLPTLVVKETKNPLSDLKIAAAFGKPVYQANCSLCHGDTGEGNGPAGASFKTNASSLVRGTVTTKPDGELFLVSKNGKNKMPPAKNLSDEQLWQVTAFIRTFAKK